MRHYHFITATETPISGVNTVLAGNRRRYFNNADASLLQGHSNVIVFGGRQYPVNRYAVIHVSVNSVAVIEIFGSRHQDSLVNELAGHIPRIIARLLDRLIMTKLLLSRMLALDSMKC